MCLYPKLIENPKYRANKKNGGKIPPIKDERVRLVPIGCGKCIECMKKRASQWRTRLHEEIKHDKRGYFVTLTISNEAFNHLSSEVELTGYDLDNKVATKAVKYFLERWRKKHKKSVKHWLVTELGGNGTERIHIHGLIWTNHKEDIEDRWNSGKVANGRIHIGEYVNAKTINYIVKYLTKTDLKHANYKPKILTSRGIGFNYVGSKNHENNYYKGDDTNSKYRLSNGQKIELPIYYKNYTYTDEQKEELWIKMLDKKERYVLGERISIKESEKRYEARRAKARRKNDRLKFGSNKVDWNKKKYEMQRKWLIHQAIKATSTAKEIKEIKKIGKN